MIQRLQAKRNSDEGFTLIELLIVIIVLGILAAIVVFAVGSTRSDSVKSACKTNVKSLELSAEAVNTHAGAYPALSVNSLNADNTNLLAGGSNGALLKSWPGITDYKLQYVGNATSYQVHVWSKGTTEGALGAMSGGTDLGTSNAGCDNPAL